MTRTQQDLLAAWVRECREIILSLPGTKGPTGTVFSAQLPDVAQFKKDWTWLRECAHGDAKVSLETPDALWRVAEAVQEQSNFGIFSRTLYARAICHRAIRGIYFEDDKDGQACLKLLLHFPMFPPPPVPLAEWGF